MFGLQMVLVKMSLQPITTPFLRDANDCVVHSQISCWNMKKYYLVDNNSIIHKRLLNQAAAELLSLLFKTQITDT